VKLRYSKPPWPDALQKIRVHFSRGNPMRFSPIKFLHGLLYTAPVLFLSLAACGGGGGGSTPPPAVPLASAYILSVNVTGVSGVGVVLRNNGGNDLTVATPGTYPFTTAVVAGSGYDVTVLSHPSSPVQVCTVTSPLGSMPAANLTVAVSCVAAYTIGGTIQGDSTIAVSGIGPILQNNSGDDLFIPVLPGGGAPVNFKFNIPVAGGNYNVIQLSRAKSPGQTCDGTTPGSLISPAASGAVSANVILTITCVAANIAPKSAYVTNSTDNTVSAYVINPTTGVLTAGAALTTGAQPYSVSVDPTGRFAYVANHSSSNISAYSIGGTGALTAIDANGAVTGTQSTIAAGTYPISVTVHPSGKFAYVVNESSASISAYSIDTTSGALSAIDANGAVTGTQATIATGTNPYAVTIDPLGKFAYVANYNDGTISAYTINQTSGALTAMTSSPFTAGTGPSSIAIDPTGKFAVVANNVGNNVMSYTIDSSGILTLKSTTGVIALSAPRSVAINPNTGGYAYVANAGGGTTGITAYTINPDGTLTAGASYAAGTTPISVNVDPSGQFVYVANLGSPYGVSTYTIVAGGALTLVGTAATGTGPTSVTTTQ
jgi:6-phosphogluconolactonase